MFEDYRLSRRSFASVLAASSFRSALGANDGIRAGVIGSGNRGRLLMRTANLLPGVSLVAVSDIYEGARSKGLELAAPGADGYGDYRRVLDRKDIDAVIIATHNHWHHQIAMDALSAVKDIYIEKPMTHKLEEGPEIVAAARRHNRIVQIGTHRRSSPVHRKAREMVASGLIGKVTFCRVFWSRNTTVPQWRLPIPADASPETIDWTTYLLPTAKRPFDAARFFQWFCYWDYCKGIAADLLVHSLDAAHMVLGLGEPERVVADGDILFWKDGREVPDTMSAIFHYPEGVQVNFSCTFANGRPGWRDQFFGKDGTIELIGSNDLLFYPEPTATQKREEFRITSAELTGKKAHELHVENFFECVRSRKRTNCPEEVGAASALCSHLSDMALRERRTVLWDAERKQAS